MATSNVAPRSYQALVGKYVQAVQITVMKSAAPSTVFASVLSADTTLTGTEGVAGQIDLVAGASYYGYLEDVEFEQEYESEDCTMLGMSHADEVSGCKRTTVTFTELLKYKTASNLGLSSNFLSQAFNNTVSSNADGDENVGRIIKVVIERASKRFTFYCKMRSYRERYSKGKCLGVMTCTVHDPQVAVASVATATNQNPVIALITSGPAPYP